MGHGKWGIVAALLAIVHPVNAQAQQMPCIDRVTALAHLAKEYGETPAAMGLSSNGAVVEVLASPGGKTWTVIVTFPDGRSCPVADGTGWETVKTPAGTGG